MSNPSGEALSFWFVGAGCGEIRRQSLPPLAEHQVLVRTLFTGISRGTESLVFNGDIPPGEFERMRAPFQEGRFPFPVKYGYCNVGCVERGPDGLQGRTIFSLYPHQTRFIVPADAAYLLPEDVPPGRAILAANLEAVVNGLWDAAPRIGDRIAVVGAGVLGCLSAWLAAKIAGCRVTLVDINPARAEVAAALGVSFALPGDAASDADLVIHASGTGEGLATALGLAGFEASVIELSWFGARKPMVPLGEAFHSRRLTLRASQVGTVATAQRGRWSSRRRMEFVLSLLRDSTLDVLITGESKFADLPSIMPGLAAASGSVLCHRIVY